MSRFLVYYSAKRMDFELECTHCKRMYTQACHLLRHLRDAHGLIAHSWCKICKQTFPDDISRNEHLRICHLGESFIECKRCGRNISYSYFNRHLKKCLGNRLFYCLKCRFIYMSEDDLNRHIEQFHEYKVLLEMPVSI